MIDGIGKSGTGAIGLQRAATGQPAAVAGPAVAAAPEQKAAGLGGVVAALVASGPPIDTDKVASLRQAIAEGRYAIDPDLIADRMIEADLRR